MKNYLKITILAVAMLSFAAAAHAQTEESVIDLNELQAQEDNSTDFKKQEIKKRWWQFGITVREGGTSPFSSEKSIAANAGYRLNKKNYIGISAGYGKGNTYIDADCAADLYYNGIPVTFEYLHNFYLGKAKKHSIYLGGEFGMFHSWETATSKCLEEEEVYDLGEGIFAIKTGFDFQIYKRLHLNFGLRIGVLSLGLSAGISF